MNTMRYKRALRHLHASLHHDPDGSIVILSYEYHVQTFKCYCYGIVLEKKNKFHQIYILYSTECTY